jgi:carotenoid 1,2-hydratase
MTILHEAEDRFHDLSTPGAYEWSYFDGLSEDGRWGFVAIWFRGIPMSPYYSAAIDRHRDNPSSIAPDPLDYVAFNFNLYDRGKRVCYALHERPRALFETDYETSRVRLGGNVLDAAVEDDGRRIHRLRIDTRLPFQRSRVEGEIVVKSSRQDLGRIVQASPGSYEGHYWVPAALDGTFAADLRIGRWRGSERISFAGRAYHDRNFGTEPLYDLPGDWQWGRLHSGPYAFVYFQVARGDPAREFRSALLLKDGALVAHSGRFVLAAEGRRPHWMTLPYFDALSGDSGSDGLRFDVRPLGMLDSGPFYHRFLSEVRLEIPEGGEIRGRGIGELLRPSRLRVAVFRPFVRFRVRRGR